MYSSYPDGKKTTPEQNSATSPSLDIAFNIEKPTPLTEKELKENQDFLTDIEYQCAHLKLALILRNLCPPGESEPLMIASAINQTANKLKLAKKDQISARDVMIHKGWPIPEAQSTTLSSNPSKPYYNSY